MIYFPAYRSHDIYTHATNFLVDQITWCSISLFPYQLSMRKKKNQFSNMIGKRFCSHADWRWGKFCLISQLQPFFFEISHKLNDFHFTNVSCSCTHGIHVYSACWTCCFEVVLNGFQSSEWHGEGKDNFFGWKSAVFLVLLERLMNYQFGMSIFKCRSR